jgi:hypothetical protein
MIPLLLSGSSTWTSVVSLRSGEQPFIKRPRKLWRRGRQPSGYLELRSVQHPNSPSWNLVVRMCYHVFRPRSRREAAISCLRRLDWWRWKRTSGGSHRTWRLPRSTSRNRLLLAHLRTPCLRSTTRPLLSQDTSSCKPQYALLQITHRCFHPLLEWSRWG